MRHNLCAMGGLLSISLVVPLGVHEGWWAKNSGDFLLAGAAIFAAAVAAFVSIENRRKELAQDRYLRDREHIRDTLDATVTTMSGAQTAVGNFYAHVAPMEAFRDEQRQRAQHAVPPQTAKLEAREKEVQEKLGTERDKARPQVQELAFSQVRLGIRLPEGHPIAAKHAAAYDAANKLFVALLPGVDDNRSQAERTADGALNELRHELNRSFRDACREWFTAESPPS